MSCNYYLMGSLGEDKTHTIIFNLMWNTWAPQVDFMGFNLSKINNEMPPVL
jgi:hypothetical protein